MTSATGSNPSRVPTSRGRGAADNPPNRFERISLERDPDWDPAEDPARTTQFYRDTSQSIVSYNESPDLGFRASINPYRGCEHGCIYCYARPTHEYLGFSAGLDFESRILIKDQAPELLRSELASPRWQPQVIAVSGVTDAYQPVERQLGLTRKCMNVLATCRNPVTVVTKNHLVTRDLDLLGDLAQHQAAALLISVTTLDETLASRMEPRTSRPRHRLEAIRLAKASGVPVGVLMAPIIPGLNDHEIPRVLNAAAEAGAQFAGYVVLRLPFGLAPMFEEWLGRHYPDRQRKVLQGIRAMREGKLNDAAFGSRMRGTGPWADQIRGFFQVSRRRAGLRSRMPVLSHASFRAPSPGSVGAQGEFEWGKD